MKKNEKEIYRLNITKWNITRGVYFGGGFLVFLSAILSLVMNINWSYFTIFVGFMFMNFAITGFCPMAITLDKLGLKRD